MAVNSGCQLAAVHRTPISKTGSGGSAKNGTREGIKKKKTLIKLPTVALTWVTRWTGQCFLLSDLKLEDFTGTERTGSSTPRNSLALPLSIKRKPN